MSEEMHTMAAPHGTLTTIEAIRAARFVGNHAADAATFGAISAFIRRPDVPMPVKIEALSVMLQRGMGFDLPATEAEVRALLDTQGD